MDDKLVKIDEAAKILAHSRSWLEKHPEGIPVVKIGRSIRYRLSDLQKIVANGVAA